MIRIIVTINVIACLITGIVEATVSLPVFSESVGYYSESVSLYLSHSHPDARIYYSLDGSEPDKKAERFLDTIFLHQSTVVRAIAYISGQGYSDVATGTYLINERFTLPVVSVVIPPDDLWDEERGMYVMGPNANETHPHYGANFWKRWEREGHIEFFEYDSSLAFSQDVGFRIFGGWSRTFEQKSFKFYAREEYGDDRIRYPVFNNRDINEYKCLVLRNGGSDCDAAHFRDPLLTNLLKNSDIDIQAFRTVIVFLNGAYWGIYHLRERIDEYYIEANRSIDRDSIDIIEKFDIVKHGRGKLHKELIRFLKNEDLAVEKNYKKLQTFVDVDNYIKYTVAQLYIQNRDAGGNTRMWRSIGDKGKWRWILYDTDLGYSRFNKKAYKENMLEFASEPEGPFWPNPPWSTFIFRKMLASDEFKISLINQIADDLNTIYAPDTVLKNISWFRELLTPEMTRHLERWNGTEYHWKKHIEIIQEFAQKRPQYMRKHVMDFFELKKLINVKLYTDGVGRIKINSVIASTDIWEGTYFTDVPIKLIAIPGPNSFFSGWEGIGESKDTLLVYLSGDTLFKAKFSPIPYSNLADSIILNEFSFFIPDSINRDWIELFNRANQSIDLSGWKLMDNKESHVFYLPENLVLDSGQYIVLASDINDFEKAYPGVVNVVGGFGFGLNSYSDQIRLFDKEGLFVDSLTYKGSDFQNKMGRNSFSVSLNFPDSSNDKKNNWYLSDGTPGKINDRYDAYLKNIEQKYREDLAKKRMLTIYLVGGSLFFLFLGIVLYVYDVKRRKKLTVETSMTK